MRNLIKFASLNPGTYFITKKYTPKRGKYIVTYLFSNVKYKNKIYETFFIFRNIYGINNVRNKKIQEKYDVY